MEQMISCFSEVFLHTRLARMIKEISRKVYYYSDDTEIEQICSFTKGLLKESAITDSLFGQDGNLNKYLMRIFRNYIYHSDIIHFDALITFSKRHLSNDLEAAVAYGIDELKREEEHQNYIESIRLYLKNKQSYIDRIYILQGDPYSFYKGNGDMYSRLELRSIMVKEPLYIIGLDENEWHLSPLITLNPKQICIYGNDPTEAKTVTLMKIFEERVQFLPDQQFPFVK